MVVAGLRNAVELAELAMEETGFGVFEDKVVKNYIATEFLYDYLKDKRSVGVIDEDPERGIQYVAEPIGVVLALTPITNPTSTVLFKAIVAAKTRNAMIFRPSARAARCASARSRSSRRRASAPGCRRTRSRSSPTRRSTSRSTSSTTRASTSSGPPAAPRPSPPPTRRASRASASGPATRPCTCTAAPTCRMAVVDMLISKTFDASVICPAEQTCVIDDAIYDETVAELERMGARLLDRGRGGRARRPRVRRRRQRRDARARPVVRQPRPRWPASSVRADAKVLLAPLPSDLDELARHPFVQEKLMPVLGLVRSPSVEHAHRGLRAGDRARRPRPHLRRLRDRRGRVDRFAERDPHRPHPRQRAHRRRRARRRLQLDDADVLARLRHLGRLGHHRQRQLPQPAEHQDGLAPPGAAAVVPRAVGHLLQRRRDRQPAPAARRARRCS